MRLAMVGRYFNRQGGVSRVLAELSDRASRDHAVDVYAHEVLDRLPGASTRFIELPMLTRPALAQMPTFDAGVRRRLDPADYDVVHVHDGQALLGDVHTFHSALKPWLEQARRDAGLKGRLSRVWPPHVADERWERRVAGDRRFLLVAISRVIGRELEAHLGVDPDRIRVIHNGVDVEDFQPAASRAEARAELPPGERPPAGETVLVFVGMYFLRKGLGVLLRAVAALPPGRPLTVWVVGGDDPAPFAALARELGLGERVRFFGHRREVAPYLRAADLFVFPTAYEPFGLVITEALACGTPAITTAAAGAAELMEDGREGFLLDRPQDVDAVRAALERYLALDADARAAMAAAARRSAEATSWDAIWGRYEELFAEVAAAKRAGRPAWAT